MDICAAIASLWRKFAKKNTAGIPLNWYTSVLEVIDMRSFTSIWYWIVIAVVWSSTAHWTLGVPFDAVTRARRAGGGQAEDDLDTLVRLNCNRLIHIMDVSGIWIVGFGFFMLTMLLLVGFGYKLEIAQALFLIAAPWSLVALLTIRNARLIHARHLQGQALRAHIARMRFFNQLIGLVAIFITAFWGMWHNLSATVL